MGSSEPDGDDGVGNTLYLKGRKRPYTLTMNEYLVEKWLAMGYIEEWPERSTPESKAFRKTEEPPKFLNRNEKG